MHKIGRNDSLTFQPHPKFGEYATGLRWAPFVEHRDDTVHMAYGRAELSAGGETASTVHAYEKALYVTDGRLEVWREGRVLALQEGDHILLPTGAEHALRNRTRDPARWIEMAAPQPKPSDGWTDTWFSG